MQLATAIQSHISHDHLTLRQSKSVRAVLDKYKVADKGQEEVQFSDFVVKINPKGVPQERVMLITNLAIYNLIFSTTLCLHYAEKSNYIATVSMESEFAIGVWSSGPFVLFSKRFISHAK